MRRARWGCFGTSWLLVLCAGCAPLHDPIERVTQVEVQATLQADARGDPTTPDRDHPWRALTLPARDLGSAALGLPPGQPHWADYWFRLHYRPAPDTPAAILVPRSGVVSMFARFNAVTVRDQHWDSGARWTTPALFVAPGEVLRSGADNEILIAVQNRGGLARLPALEVGPADELRRRYERRLLLTEDAPRIATTLQLALGVFAFAFWWRRRSETAYLDFGFSSLAWSIHLVPYHAALTAEGQPAIWVWSLGGAALAWVVATTYAFVMRFLGVSRDRQIRRLRIYALVSSTLTLLAPQLGPAAQAPIWAATVVVLPAAITAFVLVVELPLVWTIRTRETATIAVALWVQLAFAIHDALHAFGWVPIENIALVPLSASLTMVVFGYSIVRRYADSLARVEHSRAQLKQELSARTLELEASHARLRAIEREQALADERQRLMREMHDGVGSALMSSLVLVEQGRLDSAEIAQVLRESIDDLKLTIDSLEPIGHDLLTLLGTLRFRLGTRLEKAGLRLEWQVRDLPPLPWLDAAASLQVLRILQEALTNVVKHARASVVHVETERDGGEVVVRVIDNGHGFACDTHGGEGRGLTNMRRRAETVSGRLEIRSREGWTEVSLRLPIDPAPRA